MSQVSLNSTASQLISNNTYTSNYVLNTSNFLQQNINTKQATIIGGASTITTNNLTTGMVLVSDVSGKVSTHGTVTSSELTFLDGATSSIQTQLNAKEPSFSVLGLSKGGIGTTTLAINTLIGSGNTANQIVSITAGTGISISGGTISGAYTAGTGVSISGTTIGLGVIGISNGGIGTSSLAINRLIGSGNTANQIVAISAGTGISISGGTISGAYTGGTNITVSGTTIGVSGVIGLTNGGIGTSSLAINTLIGSGNTANQIVAITAGTGISISGTTIGLVLGVIGLTNGGIGTSSLAINTLLGSGNTANQIVAISAGTGISISGGTISGTYTGGTNITVSGTTIGVSGVIGLTNGGIGTTTITANSLLGATTANTISGLSLGTGLSISGSTLNVSSTNTTPILSLANNYINLNMTNNLYTTLKKTFNNTIVKYNNNYNITNNSNFIIKNILNYNNNYILQQSDYIQNVNYNNIVSIVCSSYNTVYLENTGKVLACGFNNTSGQGITGTLTTTGTVYVPQYVLGTNGTGTQMTGIVKVVSSDYSTLYLENTGKVLACGYNTSGYGITGILTTTGTVYVPKYVLGTSGVGTQMTGIVDIVCSNYHTVFLENTGKVLACGNNGAGPSGNGMIGTLTTNTIVYIPQYVLGTNGTGTQMTGIVSIACTNNGTVFLENTGKVLACGDNGNNYGIAGTLTTSGQVYVSKYVLGTSGVGTQMTGIVSIACSDYSTVYLENTGKVLACGFNNNDGFNGYGITGTLTVAGVVYVPQYVLGTSGIGTLTGIVSIVCSNTNTVYLENTGKVLAIGNNTNTNYTGITGTLTVAGVVYAPQYVLGTGGTGTQMTGIVSIACSSYNIVYLENTGKVLACGYNNSSTTIGGITGTLTTNTIVYVPQYVLGTSGVGTQMIGIINISCTSYNTVYLENTGKILSCGYNNANSTSGLGITGTLTTTGTVYAPQYVIYTQNTEKILKNNININTTYYNKIVKAICAPAGGNTVYLENTGKVLSCGDNGYATIGTLTTTGTVYVPQYVLGTSGVGTQMTGIINIVGSDYITVYLENTGKVLACGYNNYISNSNKGLTGTLSTTGTVYVSQYVLGTSGVGTQMTGIVSIVCSNTNTVYLENTGKVLACGHDITGTLTSSGTVFVPRYVLGTSGAGTQMTGIVSIACSGANTLYLENTGKVLSSGNNFVAGGITGTLTTSGAAYIPQYVLGTSGVGTQMTGIVKIACSGILVFLENTGKVLSCGDNTNAQTGTLTTTGTVYIAQYVLGTSGTGTQMTGIVDIVCGSYHTVYLENTGKVLSCGHNMSLFSYGITGTRTTAGIEYVPQYVLGTNGTGTQMTGIVSIVCSEGNTIYLENTGKVLACGNNSATGVNATGATVYVPQYVLGTSGTGTMTGIINIACSVFTVVFLENTGKLLACSSRSNVGISGTLTIAGTVRVPQYVIYTQNMLKNYIINAINGYNCILAITDTNTVIANYDNTYGKLGTIYPTYNYNNFVINYTGSGNLSGVAKIACGLYHTVFLLYTNIAYSCGFNIYGQLGTNNTTSYIPTAITNGTSISNIACGLYHTVLLSGTTAKSCGLNNYGQLGLSDNNNRSSIANITLANVSDINCGEYFTVLEVGTTVYSTGLNNKGQLGIGNTTNTNIPTQVLAINNAGGTITNVNKIKCTKNNIVFLLLNNTIAMCGDNINNIYNDNSIYYNYPLLLKIISETKTTISDIYTNIYSDEIYIKTS